MNGKGSPKHMTPLDRALAILARREGQTIYAIAKALNRQHGTISRLVKKVKIDRCPKNKPTKSLTESEKLRIRLELAAGRSPTAVARYLGRSWKTINRYLIESTTLTTTTSTPPESNVSKSPNG